MPGVLLTSAFFHRNFVTFAVSKKYRYGLNFDTQFQIILTWFKFLKVFILNMVGILKMSAKLATLHFLKLRVFWNTLYEVIISVQDVINILSRDWNYVLDVVMWAKFANAVFVWEKLSLSFIRIWPEKPSF